jgi:hypothetical protein
VITTVDGRRLSCTANHPFLVSDDDGFAWVPAQDLHPGDTLVSGATAITESTPSLDLKFYALGQFLGGGWLMENEGQIHVGTCVPVNEQAVLEEGLLPVWRQLAIESEKIIEYADDNRDVSPLPLRCTPDNTVSLDMMKPQVFRLLTEKYGFHQGKGSEKRLPGCYWAGTPDQKRSFLRGLFDVNGSVVVGQRRSLSLVAANEELARDVLLALSEFGIVARTTTSTILQVRGHAGFQAMARHVWFRTSSLALTTKANKFHETLSPWQGCQVEQRRGCVVRCVEEGPEQAVFNLDVPGPRHYVAEDLVTHNCTLVETYPAHHDSYVDFQKTLKVAYLYAKTVTLIPTHDPRTNAVMNRNRRIGCSMSGIRQAIAKTGRREFLNWCDKGYQYIQDLDLTYSEWLGIPRSIKTTSVKPSGTVSILAGATPGIHPPHSPYYIRNIRVSEYSPLCQAARDAGYKVEKDAYADATFVISFPVASHCDKGSKDVSLWEQVSLAADLQKYWADNQVSATISFTKSEAYEISAVLEAFEDRVKAISFLPRGDDHGYVQAPYIEITREEYEAMSANLRPMVMDVVKTETEDKWCDGVACEIDFSKPALTSSSDEESSETPPNA